MSRKKRKTGKRRRQMRRTILSAAAALSCFTVTGIILCLIFAGRKPMGADFDEEVMTQEQESENEASADITDQSQGNAASKDTSDKRQGKEASKDMSDKRQGKEASKDMTDKRQESKASEERTDKPQENKEKGDSEAEGVISGKESGNDIEMYEEEAEDLLAEMSLEEKVYQMFIVTPEQLTGAGTVTAAGSATRESLQKYPVGGLIYLSSNLRNKEQTSEMLKNTQEYALESEGFPLFLCVDEEGGRVARVANNSAFGLAQIKSMKDIESVDEAYETGSTIGRYLSELGFNVNFAPDADVLTNPDNAVIGDRSFGDDPGLVTDDAVAYSDGLHLYGVLSTFKHFPGHGATADDTHQGFAYTDKTLEELEQKELLPFMAAQDGKADMVMIAHISVPAILGDDTPCTLSRYMITDVLREKMGYEGLIVTDAMNMGAITSAYSNSRAVIAAINAGADLVLMPVDFKTAANAVISAVESGEIDIASVDESVKRILVKKLRLMKEGAAETKTMNLP